MDSKYHHQSFLAQSQGQVKMQMLEKPGTARLSLLSARAPSSFPSRPLSEATEIVDTDFEADEDSSEQRSSSRRSAESFGNDSSTTLSTPDELHTPGPYDSAPLGLQWDEGKPVQGPLGPHLFRTSVSSSSSTDKIDEQEWYFPTSPVNLDDVKGMRQAPVQREQLDHGHTSEPSRSASRTSSIQQKFPRQDESVVRSWTPTQVAEWMYEYGIEDMIIERFIHNDISGSILLDIQIDDLKELDIRSFGKRHRLMTMIQHLRDSLTPGTETSTSPRSSKVRKPELKDGPRSPTCDLMPPTSPPTRRSRRNRINKDGDIISPAESASIVAIEQLLPKPHKCSKGENCAKFQRRQRKIARIAEEFPNEFIQVAGNCVRTTVGETSTTSESAFRPKSDAQPSVVASSDVLGPAQQPELKLNAENLNGVQPRDPQENVRQFLNFQHVDSPPVQSPDDQGHLETFPPLSPPNPSSPAVHMAANLRSLPKLTIPQDATGDALSQRTITPSMGARQFGSATATQEYNPYYYPPDTYRQGTPFSEMDVPITAISDEPLAREASQSVPPHLTYGRTYQPSFDPIDRSQSTRPEHRRRPSFASHMASLEEGKPLNPINNPADMVTRRGTPSSQPLATIPDSASPTYDPDVSHSGYMKKRRTTRLLRHEWQDAHFTLKGTVLAMHKHELDAQRNSRALESIDVDDYAVACSSLATSSKLTAAFKKSLLKRAGPSSSSASAKGMDETAFAFSLVPATEKVEKKIFNPSGKSHHFAVKSRDDRINWMRELMLAKALKKGKDDGEEMQVNGNVI